MCSSELWEIAKQTVPQLQLRDLWLILRQMQSNGLGTRLSPNLPTGKVYALTELGRKVLRETFGLEGASPPARVHWHSYSLIARAKVRRLVLQEIGTGHVLSNQLKTASRIRKNLLDTHPLGLNAVLRALKELGALGLIAFELGAFREKKLYRLTRRGKRILWVLSFRNLQKRSTDAA
jgi:DNA-binding PadR family transcriptional regulator